MNPQAALVIFSVVSLLMTPIAIDKIVDQSPGDPLYEVELWGEDLGSAMGLTTPEEISEDRDRESISYAVVGLPNFEAKEINNELIDNPVSGNKYGHSNPNNPHSSPSPSPSVSVTAIPDCMCPWDTPGNSSGWENPNNPHYCARCWKPSPSITAVPTVTVLPNVTITAHPTITVLPTITATTIPTLEPSPKPTVSPCDCSLYPKELGEGDHAGWDKEGHPHYCEYYCAMTIQETEPIADSV